MGGGHVPSGEMWPLVPHYYGDIVRQLMLGASALMLFGAPFYGDYLHVELPFEVFGALVFVALAALTNPWKKMALAADAIGAGVGMVIYQTWALYGYGQVSPVAFVLREALAILFMFAFYFSVKTVRAMVLHQIGKREQAGEFDEEPMEDLRPEEESEFLNSVRGDAAEDERTEGGNHRQPGWADKAGD